MRLLFIYGINVKKLKIIIKKNSLIRKLVFLKTNITDFSQA